MYKDRASIVLENAVVRAEIIPDPGGKLASLKDKRTGYEFMVQRSAPSYKTQPFDGVYVDAECSGFDDMFPTIDPCEYESYPWQGTKLADHGEVWSLPWKILVQEPGLLGLSTNGIRFPYVLRKRITLLDKGLRYDYTLSNPTPYDFDYLWAGHLMVNIEEGLRMIVPEECRNAVTVLSNGSSKFGDTHQWPTLRDKTGRPYPGNIVRNRAVEGFEKYYFTDPLEKGWCQLDYPNGKDRLRIDFSGQNVPYLGILMNEEGWDGLYNVIIEPCSICYDRPDLAKKFGQTSTVAGGSSVVWTLNVSVG